MTSPSGKCAARSQGVATVPSPLVADLREGLRPMISAVSLEISVLVEQSGEINEETYVKALRRLDALRSLLNRAGVTPGGLPLEPVALTERDHPDLALKALEAQYRKRLSRTEDTESMGFTTPTEPLVELGRLVAAFRERLGYGRRGDQAG